MATDPASPLAFVPTPPGLAAPRDFVLPVQLDECTPLAILEALGTTATAAASEVDCKRREDALSMQDQANGTSLSTYAGHSSSDGIESLHDLQTDLQTGPSERHDAARHEPASASSQATRAQPFPSSLIANPCAVKTENFESQSCISGKAWNDEKRPNAEEWRQLPASLSSSACKALL